MTQVEIVVERDSNSPFARVGYGQTNEYQREQGQKGPSDG